MFRIQCVGIQIRRKATRWKLFYSILTPARPGCFSWESPWQAKVLSRVAFFVWTMVHEKILTANNLQCHGFVIVSRCYICKASMQSMDYLLLHCLNAWGYGIWSWVYLALIRWCFCLLVCCSLVGYGEWGGVRLFYEMLLIALFGVFDENGMRRHLIIVSGLLSSFKLLSFDVWGCRCLLRECIIFSPFVILLMSTRFGFEFDVVCIFFVQSLCTFSF